MATADFHRQESRGSYEPLLLFLQTHDPWLQCVDIPVANEIVVGFNIEADHRLTPFVPIRVEWTPSGFPSQLTECDFGPASVKLSDAAAAFVVERNLMPAVRWVQIAAPLLFEGSHFEFDLLPGQEGEETLLALRVHATLEPVDFRERVHAICDAMVEAGHRTLYEVLSIFQRRTIPGERQGFPWYSPLSAE